MTNFCLYDATAGATGKDVYNKDTQHTFSLMHQRSLPYSNTANMLDDLSSPDTRQKLGLGRLFHSPWEEENQVKKDTA